MSDSLVVRSRLASPAALKTLRPDGAGAFAARHHAAHGAPARETDAEPARAEPASRSVAPGEPDDVDVRTSTPRASGGPSFGSAADRVASTMAGRIFRQLAGGAAGPAVADLRMRLGALFGPSPTAAGLAALVGELALPDAHRLLRFFRRTPEAISRVIERAANAVQGDFVELVRDGFEFEEVERFLKGLSTMRQTIETHQRANAGLWRDHGMIFLEWPALSAEASPMRLWIARGDADAQGPGGAAGARFTVSVRVVMTRLGEVRARVSYGPEIQVSLRADDAALLRIERELARVPEALRPLGRPVRVDVRALSPDEEPFPDLATLSAKMNGRLGRMHVKA
ncbi:hypothetical protein K8I61_08555 [bacterium]|nr:hypothetical protein [bacterium]